MKVMATVLVVTLMMAIMVTVLDIWLPKTQSVYYSGQVSFRGLPFLRVINYSALVDPQD